ncbi:MAG: hypothetical protein NW200_06920 [Hyphomonadaceae bacterium]|nr:hypothetical protein [Hyphomonadaceae bacterium]
MHRLLPLAALLALAACVAPGRGDSLGGRYVDPYTCEIKNKRAEDPPYDPGCIQAAQKSAINAAKNAQKGQAKK